MSTSFRPRCSLHTGSVLCKTHSKALLHGIPCIRYIGKAIPRQGQRLQNTEDECKSLIPQKGRTQGKCKTQQHQNCGDETRRLKHALQLLQRPHEEDGTKRQTHKPLGADQSHRRQGSHLPRSSCGRDRNSISVNSSCQALDFQAFCALPSFNSSRTSEVGTISTLVLERKKKPRRLHNQGHPTM